MLSTITRHPESALMLSEVVKIRDCVKGSPFVKAKGLVYLPHPSALDTTSPEALLRYDQYKSHAKFQGIPAQTLKTWTGKVDASKTMVELPERIAYLENDVDGDGLSIYDGISQTLANVLSVKWHVLVDDYQGLSDVDLKSLSRADLAAIKPRATVKQYTRENVIYWHFDRVNGKMQLAYIMLLETGLEFNDSNLTNHVVESYLILALDENGEYYQQKIVRSTDGLLEGERSPMLVGNEPLKWLPVRVVIDEPMQAGAMPMELGYLAPICDLTLQNYVISADKMETLNAGKPTLNYYGVDEMAWEQFKAVNGRDYVAVGLAVNLWSKDVQAEYVSAQNDITGYTSTMQENNDEMRALGASFPTDSTVDKTATEAEIDSAEQVSRLTVAAQCVEDAWRFMALCCGMFEGLWSQDAIEQNLDSIVIDMNKEFSKREMSPQKAQQVLAAIAQGVISQAEGLKIFVKGGWTVSEYEELIARQDSGEDTGLSL